MQWKDFTLKTICEEEEWRAQFEPIKDKFAKCLGLKKIIMDENDPENDEDRFSMFRSENNNPYCRSDQTIFQMNKNLWLLKKECLSQYRIAKSWDSCTHYLKGLNCIEPNSDEITKGSTHGFSGMLDDHKHYDPEDINSMVKPYKTQCEMAKFAANYGPFGSHGNYLFSLFIKQTQSTELSN